MANPTPSDILKVSGRLCSAPTDLSTAYPHGGTALGTVGKAQYDFAIGTRAIKAEELGTTVEVLYTGEEGIFSCVLRGWDRDALANVFLDTAAGSTTGRRIVQGRTQVDTVRAGSRLSPNAVLLYFSPRNSQHPGILIYQAIPMPEQAARVNATLNTEVQIAAQWRITPDSARAGQPLYQIGLAGDLTL